MTKKTDIRSLTYDTLTEHMKSVGEKPYRTSQIFDWLHKKRIESFDEMTNIPDVLRKKLSEDFEILQVSPLSVLVSEDGTRKYIHALYDGSVIETVMLRYGHGNTACISSQAGCRMGCRFCASTTNGLERNLTAGEMISQVYSIEKDTGERINHVVVMGSGEPLDNFDALTAFFEIATDKRGADISGRNITVSTCGLADGIRRLADRKYTLTLALSLHAVTDKKRQMIMPVAKRYPISELKEALAYYFETTGRRISLEYCVMAGFNDTDEDVKGLSAIARELSAHVNLIPVNPTEGHPDLKASRNDADKLKNKLEKNNINVTIRREMGRDIEGACGQLRLRFIKDHRSGDQNA